MILFLSLRKADNNDVSVPINASALTGVHDVKKRGETSPDVLKLLS